MESTRSTASSSASSSDGRSVTDLGPRVVLADANAFFLPLTSAVDLDREVRRLAPAARLAVAASTLAELDRLAARRVPGAGAARELAARLPVVPSPGRGDAGLLRVAVTQRAWVVTADRELQERLLGSGVTVLVPRERSRLALRRPGTSPPRATPGRRATVKNGPRVVRAERRRRRDARR